MNTIRRWHDDDSPTDDTVFLRPSHQTDQLSQDRTTRRRRITIASINAACDEFFRSRGMSSQASPHPWQSSQHGAKPKPTD